MSDQYTTVGQTFQLQLAATDPDGDTITYSATGLPDGLSLDPVTGIVSGAVSEAALASGDTFNVLFTADDGKGGNAQQPAVIQVSRIVPIANQQKPETETFDNIDIVVRNADPTEQFTYSATGLPAFVQFVPNTNQLRSFPTPYSDAATNGMNVHQIVVTVTGNKRTVAKFPFTLTSVDKNPLAVIDDKLNKVGDNVAYTPNVALVNLLADPISYTVTFDTLPAGLTQANRAAGGQATAAGLKAVTVTINDGGQIHTRSFYWTVQDAAGPSVVGPAVVPGNTVYQYTVRWGQDVTQLNAALFVQSIQGSNVGQVTLTLLASQVVNGETISTYTAAFSNAAAAKFFLNAQVGGQIIPSLPLTVVQIVISDPSAPENGVIPPAFDRGDVGEEPVRGIIGGTGDARDVYVMSVKAGGTAANPLKPGLTWKGTYGVVGPNGGQGISQIQLGFIQHVTINAYSSTYADGTTLTANYDGQALAGKTFLDGRVGAGVPWFKNDSFTPSASSMTNDFAIADAPNVPFPLSSDLAKQFNGMAPVIPAGKKLVSTTYSQTFTLDLAVRTLDPLGSAQFFSEARATWSFYANGTIGADGKWVGNAGNQGAIVTSPNSWVTLTTNAPTPIDTADPIANSIPNKLTYTSSGP